MDDTTPDAILLREFATSQSQSAFRTLVERHQGMVYGAAWRKLSSDAAAVEISQIVFAALARKAPWLSARATVGGWLYKSTLLECSRRQRDEARRVSRERLYSEHMEIQRTTPDDEEADRAATLAPLLDDALSSLAEKDREAILLRFMRGLSLRDTGAALGTTEEAARKRVTRAVDKLHQLFRRRGVAMTVPALAATLIPMGAKAAPASLAAQAASAAASLPAHGALAGLFLKATALSRAQVALLCTTAAAVPVSMQAMRIRELETRNEVITLRLGAGGPDRRAAPVAIAGGPGTSLSAPEQKPLPVNKQGKPGEDQFKKHWEDQRRLDREARLIALEQQLGLNENQVTVVAGAMLDADNFKRAAFTAAWETKSRPSEASLQAAEDGMHATINAVLGGDQITAYAEFCATESRDRQANYANYQLGNLSALHLTESQKDGLFAFFAAKAARSGSDFRSGLSEEEAAQVQQILSPDQFRIWQEKSKIESPRPR